MRIIKNKCLINYSIIIEIKQITNNIPQQRANKKLTIKLQKEMDFNNILKIKLKNLIDFQTIKNHLKNL